jgi:hypothetical protein
MHIEVNLEMDFCNAYSLNTQNEYFCILRICGMNPVCILRLLGTNLYAYFEHAESMKSRITKIENFFERLSGAQMASWAKPL